MPVAPPRSPRRTVLRLEVALTTMSIGLGSGVLGSASASPRATLRYASHGAAAVRSTMVLRRAGGSVVLVQGRSVLARAALGRGPIVIHGSAGDDTLVVDYSRGNPVPAGGLTWDGGRQRTAAGDAIVVRGGRFRHGRIDYISRPDGEIHLDGSRITYRGLEPMDISGITIADLVLVLPNSDDIAVWEDNGTAGDDIHRLRSVNGTFETTTFSKPTNSLTINMGGGTDDITVHPTDSFGSTGVEVDNAESIHVGGLQTTGLTTLNSSGPIDQTGPASIGHLAASGGTGVALSSTGNVFGVIAVHNTSSGAVQVENSGAITIGTAGSLTGISNAGPSTSVEATGAITVSADVTSVGTVMFAADDAAAPGDNVALAPGVTVESTGGTVSIHAGDNVSIPATARVISDTGQAGVSMDSSAVDPDPGLGGTFVLRGVLSGSTSTFASGATDQDRFLLSPGGAVSLVLQGQDGSDTYQFDGGSPITATLAENGGCLASDLMRFAEPTGVTLDLGSTSSQAVATGLTLTLSTADGFENVTGTNHGDHVTGNACANRLLLRGGDDTGSGLGAGDVLLGNRGVDQLTGGPGTDMLKGGSGGDTLNGADGSGGDTMDGQSGIDTCTFDPGDTVRRCEN
jgi:hypothetical protein